MSVQRRRLDAAAELRSLQDLAHRTWLSDPRLLNFEASFGTLAWERGGFGRSRAFERDGGLAGWARLQPGYRRIRAAGEWDQAPASLVWQVDPTDPDREEVLAHILDWAAERSDEPCATTHNAGDEAAASLFAGRGFVHDPTEPFSGYMSQRLVPAEPAVPDGYVFLTMSELADVERRAEVHRLAWDGSSRSTADVEVTMQTWPYKPDLDFVAVTEEGALAASVLCWFDPAYTYAEIEPVGAVPEHRGRGVTAALIGHALEVVRQAGAQHAVVGARADPAYPAPRRLYRSVGFDELAIQRVVISPR